MEMSQEQLMAFCNWEIEYWNEHRPTFIMKPGLQNASAYLRVISKQLRWAELDTEYDRTLSFEENLKNLDVSVSTLYRYCKERWIDKHPGRKTKEQLREERRQARKDEVEDFKSLYNPNLSLRKNLQVMEDSGLKMSTTRLTAMIEKYYEPLQEDDSPKFDWPELPSFTDWQPQFEVPVCDWDIAEATQKVQQFPKINWQAPTFSHLWS